MYLAVSLLLLIPLLCNAQSSGTLSGTGCTSPNGQRGACTRLFDCSVLLDLLRQAQGPRRAQAYTFLRQSQCGFEGQAPVVCCPGREPRVLENMVVLPTTTTETPFRGDRALNGLPNHPNRALLPDVCGNTPADDKIYGGLNATLGQHPWVAGLEYRTHKTPLVLCGGVLISNRYVLSAAHCLFRDQRYVLASVRLGDHDIETDPDCENTRANVVCADKMLTVRIETYLRHPRYRGQPHHFDIGLIRLSQTVPFTAFIKPICLPFGSMLQDNFAGKSLTVSGWGRTETSWQSRWKLFVVVPVLSNDECLRTYSGTGINVTLDATQMCAGGEGGKDSCVGDSGGPLMSFSVPQERWYVNGIVSIGPPACGTKGQPGVYTRVGSYVDWIMDSLKP